MTHPIESPRSHLPLRLRLRLLIQLRPQGRSSLRRAILRKPVRKDPLPRLSPPTGSAKIARMMKIMRIHQRYLLGTYIRTFLFHSSSLTKLKYRPIKKLRRLAQVPLPVANKSLASKVKAHCKRTPLKRRYRVLHPLASETVKDVTGMIKGLDVKDAIKTNGPTSFPCKDYTPYVTYVDCRDKGGPSNCPGSPSPSNDGDAE